MSDAAKMQILAVNVLVYVDPISFHRAFIHVLDYSCVWVAPWQKYNGGMGLLCNSRHIRYRTTLCSVNCIVELTSKCRSFLILGRLKLNLVKYNRNWFTTPHVLVVQIKCTCTNMTLFLVCFGWITNEIRYKGNCLSGCLTVVFFLLDVFDDKLMTISWVPIMTSFA